MSGKFVVERRGKGERQKFKIPAWSHQRELKGAEGKMITLHLGANANGQHTVTGVLLSADQFTFQIALQDQSVLTYFKHATIGYSIEKNDTIKA